MSDTISRHAAIDAMTNILWHYPNECYRNLNEYEFAKGLAELGLKSVPSVQPEPLTLRVNSELTKEEYDKLMQDIKDAPIVLLPSEQPDRKPGEWLHDLLQDAIDDGIITEVQAVKIIERAKA